jgi:hypothetical protein
MQFCISVIFPKYNLDNYEKQPLTSCLLLRTDFIVSC